MNTKKIIVATMMALSVTSISTTFAAEVELDNPQNTPVSTETTISQSITDIVPYGTSAPTSHWNLGNGPYDAQFSSLYNILYTNYYFTPNSNGELFMRGRIWEETGNPSGSYKYKIICFDASTKKAVTETSGTTNGNGSDVNIRFYNLDKSKNYYFGYQNLDGSWSTLGGYTTISR